MKKFTTFLCLIILIISIVGCGNKELNRTESEVKPSKNISETAHKVPEKEISSDKAVSEKNETPEEIPTPETTSSAIFVPIGDWFLFIGEAGPFTLLGKDIEYLDIDGNVISDTDLVAGNKVEITSSGMMLESYPGQLAGVTKVKVVEVGSSEDISKYQDIIDELSQGITDEAFTIPMMNINYKTELADVSMVVEPNGGYQLNNGTSVEIGDALPLDEMTEPLPVANIGEKVDLELVFPQEIVSLTLWRLTEKTQLLSPDEYNNSSSYTFKNIEVGTYVVQAEFANGDAEYRFVCEE